MRIRRKLLDLILEIARRDELSTSQLSNCLRTSRTRASTLLHGHIARFTRRRGYLRWNIPNPRAGWKPPPGVAHG